MIFDCWRCHKKWNDFHYNVCSHCGAPRKKPEEKKADDDAPVFDQTTFQTAMNGNLTNAGDPPKADGPSFDPGGGDSGGGGASGNFSTDT